VDMSRSTMSFFSLTRPAREDQKPLRIYLPPHPAVEMFVQGATDINGYGVHVSVGKEGGLASLRLLHNRAGEPLDEYVGYKSMIVVMVGPKARELLQGMQQRFRPKWAGWAPLSKTPRFLAEIQMPYLDAVQASGTDENDVTMTDAGRRIGWHK